MQMKEYKEENKKMEPEEEIRQKMKKLNLKEN
jgi:hypothetical protein